MKGSYEDESDENVVPVVKFLLSAIDRRHRRRRLGLSS